MCPGKEARTWAVVTAEHAAERILRIRRERIIAWPLLICTVTRHLSHMSFLQTLVSPPCKRFPSDTKLNLQVSQTDCNHTSTPTLF